MRLAFRGSRTSGLIQRSFRRRLERASAVVAFWYCSKGCVIALHYCSAFFAVLSQYCIAYCRVALLHSMVHYNIALFALHCSVAVLHCVVCIIAWRNRIACTILSFSVTLGVVAKDRSSLTNLNSRVHGKDNHFLASRCRNVVETSYWCRNAPRPL